MPLTRIARTRGIPLLTLHVWLGAYRQTGPSPARDVRADCGRHRLPVALVELIQGLMLRTSRPSVASVYRQVVAVARDQGWPVPAYSMVTAIVRGLNPALLTLAHDGSRAYANTFALIYRRTDTRPNELWQADHTPLALWVLDHRGRPARPWLTVIMDDYSRAIAGYALNLSAPSSLHGHRSSIGRAAGRRCRKGDSSPEAGTGFTERLHDRSQHPDRCLSPVSSGAHRPAGRSPYPGDLGHLHRAGRCPRPVVVAGAPAGGPRSTDRPLTPGRYLRAGPLSPRSPPGCDRPDSRVAAGVPQ